VIPTNCHSLAARFKYGTTDRLGMSGRAAMAVSDVADLDIEKMRAGADQASSLLKSMANENRLLVLCYLVEGEKSVTELQRHLPLSQSALSQHLAVLRREGLVTTRREAQSIYYSLASDEARAVLSTLYELYCK